ncbi:MAG TPA: hypothetical protein VFC63_09785 [Blastocatellia bacterium]|nr:hypothetical protein [Blastocatellia bacterium]
MGKAHVCRTCPLLDTKPSKSIAIEADQTVLSWLERFDQEITAGRTLVIEDLSALQWECWIFWSNLKQMYDRAHQQRLAGMFEMLVAMMMK